MAIFYLVPLLYYFFDWHSIIRVESVAYERALHSHTAIVSSGNALFMRQSVKINDAQLICETNKHMCVHCTLHVPTCKMQNKLTSISSTDALTSAAYRTTASAPCSPLPRKSIVFLSFFLLLDAAINRITVFKNKKN